jgi:outer membrane autotransporter protein
VQANGLSLQPHANLAYVSVESGDFAESGGAAALTADSIRQDVTYTTVGLRVSTEVELGGSAAALTGMVGWRQAFGDVDTPAAFAFAGGDAFSVLRVPLAQDALTLSAGVILQFAPRASLSFSYAGQFGDGSRENAIASNLSVRF